MKKSTILLSALLAFTMSGCGTETTPSVEVSTNPSSISETSSSESGSSVVSSNEEEANPILHGHGAPNNNEGSLYALYVDDDTGKIYEKNKTYTARTSSLAKLANDGEEGKWIYTNCVAGDNFGKSSSIADAIRATLLSTNLTLKCTLGIEVTTGGHSSETDVITYLQYNFGNVFQKQEDPTNPGFDNAIAVGYSTYDVDNDQYRLFINSGGTMTEHTEYITSSNPMEQMVASNFINRCLNNQLEKTCNFALVDNILNELDNFAATNRVYRLNKTITISNSPYYDAIYGAGQYYIEFKNIEFKLTEDGSSLEYFKFTFGYGKNDRSETLEEEFLAEISNLRTTSFAIPE